MADYIEREALLFDLKTSFVPQSTTYTDAVGIAMRWIKQAPAADVAPVVRCKDCTYMEDAYVCNGFLICPASNMEITDNDFCSYGERREADD